MRAGARGSAAGGRAVCRVVLRRGRPIQLSDPVVEEGLGFVVARTVLPQVPAVEGDVAGETAAEGRDGIADEEEGVGLILQRGRIAVYLLYSFATLIILLVLTRG